LSVDNELAAFFGVACDVGDSDGEFDFQLQFHRSCQHKVIAEDFLFFVGILRIPPDADPSVGIHG